LRAILALVAVQRSSCQIRGKIGWLNVGSNIRDVCIGWMVGDGLAGKDYSSKLQWGTTEAQKPAWRCSAGSIMAEIKHNLHCGRFGC